MARQTCEEAMAYLAMMERYLSAPNVVSKRSETAAYRNAPLKRIEL
jgi:hypothetical protein